MTLPELNKVKAYIDEKLKFTDDNISKKLLDHPYFYHSVLDIYIKEKRILDNLERKKKMVYAERYDFFKFKNNFRLDSAKEIDCYINGEKVYDDVCLEYNLQENVVTYFVEILDAIKKMSFTMQSYIRMKEFLAGKV